jgi:hypothetical protein
MSSALPTPNDVTEDALDKRVVYAPHTNSYHYFATTDGTMHIKRIGFEYDERGDEYEIIENSEYMHHPLNRVVEDLQANNAVVVGRASPDDAVGVAMDHRYGGASE